MLVVVVLIVVVAATTNRGECRARRRSTALAVTTPSTRRSPLDSRINVLTVGPVANRAQRGTTRRRHEWSGCRRGMPRRKKEGRRRKGNETMGGVAWRVVGRGREKSFTEERSPDKQISTTHRCAQGARIKSRPIFNFYLSRR